MARTRHETRNQRKTRFEQFEQRLVMSAQAVANLLPEMEIAAPALTGQVVSHPLLENAASPTQAAQIADQYGFDGAGQTVAVIDSGIAWDHYALGGGFGEGHKVVGGWDFAENDANPYDDGPAGFHGSHVAGIIGSEDNQYRGVSSGVDLVALRVFDDQGVGDLDLVEQALQWIHEHKDDFDNPITTVNLSLGNEWNAFNTPEWATLEDEFAKLEAEGLFISVAAGNSFQSYGESGLSYPAVSSHVVPVASHDANGVMSDFSQRADNALVAPGESIKSTVPDHLFGGTSGNRFLGSTGTSMSAPYVAGASAVLRQANEFMGVSGIDQDTLYQQFRETADQVYDQVTGGYYYNINLEAALAAVVQDLHGEGAGATNLGMIEGGESFGGTIGKLSDVDQFTFRAQSSGEIRLNFETTHDLSPLVEVAGTQAVFRGNEVSFTVEAGRQYQFAISSAEGNGHYTVDVEFDNRVSAIEIGRVTSAELSNQSINGESLFRLNASRDGFLTVQTSTANPETMTLEVYDSTRNLVASQSAQSSELRIDVIAEQHETFYVKVIGQVSDVDLKLDNLVSLESGVLSVNGTNQNDNIFVDASNGISVQVNGLDYQFEESYVQKVNVHGLQGQDSINVQLGSEDDNVATRPDGLNVRNERFRMRADNLESIQIAGGGGHDAVALMDSVGNDSLTASADIVSLTGSGFSSVVSGFDVVFVQSTGGTDVAELNGTDGQDLFVSRQGRNSMRSDASIVVVDQFESIAVDGRGGADRANVFDTAGDDRFVLAPTQVELQTDDAFLIASSFEKINAIGGQGNDLLVMQDSRLDDVFRFDNGLSTIHGQGYVLAGHGFDNVQAISTGGYDVAHLLDSVGNDVYTSDSRIAKIESSHFSVEVAGFDRVNAVAKNGGFDRAIMVGSVGEDIVNLQDGNLSLRTDSNLSRAIGFEEIKVDTLGGIDNAYLKGGQTDERLVASFSDIELESTLQLLRMVNAENTTFDGNGGTDEVVMEEFGTLDLLESLGDQATAYLQDHTVTARDFDILEAHGRQCDCRV